MPASLELPSVPPAASIEEVLRRMTDIGDALPGGDGVACFNALYRRTTQAVYEAVQGMTFEDRPFMERLDVIFANRYFAALDAWAQGGEHTAEAWRALCEARQRADVEPLQFALAGMNAHINYDLSQSVVDTCLERDVELRRGTPQHRDFEGINDVLAQTEPAVKAWFLRGVVARMDRVLGDADDAAAMWSIRRAREAAWAAAEASWALRDRPTAREAYRRALDGLTGLAGRAMLRPGLALLR